MYNTCGSTHHAPAVNLRPLTTPPSLGPSHQPARGNKEHRGVRRAYITLSPARSLAAPRYVSKNRGTAIFQNITIRTALERNGYMQLRKRRKRQVAVAAGGPLHPSRSLVAHALEIMKPIHPNKRAPDFAFASGASVTIAAATSAASSLAAAILLHFSFSFLSRAPRLHRHFRGHFLADKSRF